MNEFKLEIHFTVGRVLYYEMRNFVCSIIFIPVLFWEWSCQPSENSKYLTVSAISDGSAGSTPRQDQASQRCNHATGPKCWPLGRFPVGVGSKMDLSNPSCGICRVANHRSWDLHVLVKLGPSRPGQLTFTSWSTFVFNCMLCYCFGLHPLHLFLCQNTVGVVTLFWTLLRIGCDICVICTIQGWPPKNTIITFQDVRWT